MLNKILISFWVLFFFSSAMNADSLDIQLQNTIQQYLNQHRNQYHLSGTQLSIILPNEKSPRDYVVGTQEYGKQKPATTSMMFQWMSVTKEYTSLLIFKLANEHQFKVTDNLGKILPGHFSKDSKNPWPLKWKRITLIQLMNMTSGIPVYPMRTMDWTKQYSLEGLANIAGKLANTCKANLGCFYPAGSKWFYSNTNYIILGLIVEKYTSESFERAINQYVLNPFKQKSQSPLYVYYMPTKLPKDLLNNMIHGSFDNQSPQESTGLSTGFSSVADTNPYYPKTWVDATNMNLSIGASAGALIGNMNTLAKLTDALYHNQLIAPASDLEQNAALMSNGHLVTNIKKQCVKQSCYAMGVLVLYAPSEGGLIWHYQGSDLPYNTLYFFIPSENVTIAIAQGTGATIESGDNSLINLAFKINTQIRQYLKLPISKKQYETNAI